MLELGTNSNRHIFQAFNIHEFYRLLTRWIVTGNQPFTEVENRQFRELLIYLRPALQDHLIRASAIRDRILDHAEATRMLTKSYLNNLSGLIAIACDAWTSSNRIAFLAIVGSWITPDWRLEETLLDFRELQGPHSGQNMAGVVAATISDLGIVDKVVALVGDNASNNGTLIQHLLTQIKQVSSTSCWDGTKGYIRCLAHVIHLAVMALLRGLCAVPASVKIEDFDFNGSSLTEEGAEDIVAEDSTESLEADDKETADPF